jgi:hypothetical protein
MHRQDPILSFYITSYWTARNSYPNQVNKVEKDTKKILRHETYEEELSNGMIPSDDRKSTLPFDFELPILFP